MVYVLIAIAAELALVFVMKFILPNSDIFEEITYFAYGSSKLLPMATGIVVFLLFKDVKIPARLHKVIGFISSSVFGVYLFHIGRFNKYIFMDLFNDVRVYITPYFVFYIAGAVLAIFAAGILVDKIRIYLLERPLMRGLETDLAKLSKKVDAWYPDSKQ